MQICDLKPPKNSKHTKKRLGKGQGSGWGKTAGKGHKGQKARSGGNVRAGFEGGQIPIYRRLPIRGFNNFEFSIKTEIVNVESLAVFEPNTTITKELLMAAGLVKGRAGYIVKILGNGELKIALNIQVDSASASAIEKIKAAGGSIELLKA